MMVCLLQNLAYDADNTSAVWTTMMMSDIEKKNTERSARNEIVCQMRRAALTVAFVDENTYGTTSIKPDRQHDTTKCKD